MNNELEILESKNKKLAFLIVSITMISIIGLGLVAILA